MIKKFNLGGKQYAVKYINKFEGTSEKLGECDSAINVIKLAKMYDGENIPEDSIEQSLYHEVVHAILDELGQYDLTKDESFVQSFSLLMHQFVKTSK